MLTCSIAMLFGALTVALPAFEVDQAPGILSQRLPSIYASAMEDRRCSATLPANRIGSQATTEFVNCERQPACISLVGRVLGAQVVVLGQVQRLDTSYLIRLGVFDVKEQRIITRLEHRHEGKVTEFERSIREQIGSLCKAVNPNWNDLVDSEKQLANLDFEAPKPVITVTKKPEPPAEKPAPSGFDELPPLPAEPLVTPPKPTPPVVATTPPPPSSALVATAPDAALPSSVMAPPTSPKPVRIPWTEIASGATVASVAVAIGLGSYSRSLWSSDRPVLADGITAHSLSHVEADRANSMAHAANAMFAVSGVLAVTSGALFVTQGGFGFSGKF